LIRSNFIKDISYYLLLYKMECTCVNGGICLNDDPVFQICE